MTNDTSTSRYYVDFAGNEWGPFTDAEIADMGIDAADTVPAEDAEEAFEAGREEAAMRAMGATDDDLTAEPEPVGSHDVVNAAGETVYRADSDADAVRWWLDNGRRGDTLGEDGEPMREVAELLELD